MSSQPIGAIVDEARARQHRLAEMVGARVAALEAGADNIIYKRQTAYSPKRSPNNTPSPVRPLAAAAAPTPVVLHRANSNSNIHSERRAGGSREDNGGHASKKAQSPLSHWQSSHHQRQQWTNSSSRPAASASTPRRDISTDGSFFASEDSAEGANRGTAAQRKESASTGGSLLSALNAATAKYKASIMPQSTIVPSIHTSGTDIVLTSPEVGSLHSPHTASPADLSLTQAKYATAPASPKYEDGKVDRLEDQFSINGGLPRPLPTVAESENFGVGRHHTTTQVVHPELAEARTLIRNAITRLNEPLDYIRAAQSVSVRKAWVANSFPRSMREIPSVVNFKKEGNDGEMHRTFSASTYAGDDLTHNNETSQILRGKPTSQRQSVASKAEPTSPPAQHSRWSSVRSAVVSSNAAIMSRPASPHGPINSSFGSHHSGGTPHATPQGRSLNATTVADVVIAAVDREQALLGATAAANRANRRQLRGLFLGEIEGADDILDIRGPGDSSHMHTSFNDQSSLRRENSVLTYLSPNRSSGSMGSGYRHRSPTKMDVFINDSPILRDAFSEGRAPLLASLFLDSVGRALVINRRCAGGTGVRPLILDSEEEREWDDTEEEEDSKIQGSIAVEKSAFDDASGQYHASGQIYTNQASLMDQQQSRPSSPLSAAMLSTPIPSHVSRTRPPSMVKPASPYMHINIATKTDFSTAETNSTFLMAHVQSPLTPRRRSVDPFPITSPQPLPPKRSPIAQLLTSHTPITPVTQLNSQISLAAAKVSTEGQTLSQTLPTGTSFFKGVTVPPERQRLLGTYDKFNTLESANFREMSNPASHSHRNSFAGSNKAGKRLHNGMAPAPHSLLTEAERRRQLRELNQDEQGPKPLTTEEVAVQVLGVEPQLGRLLAKQLDAFDRAIIEYGNGYVLGGDSISYTASLKAPNVTVCPKVRQESRHTRLIHGWKLRRMVLVGKFLYVFRYPGGEEKPMDESKDGGSSGGNTPSGGSGRQSPVGSSNRLLSHQNSNEDVTGSPTKDRSRVQTFPVHTTIIGAETENSTRSKLDKSPQSSLGRFVGLPKRKVAARNRMIMKKKDSEAFEKNCICIDISRALFDVATKTYRGKENVLLIRQNAIPNAGGTGKVGGRKVGFDASSRGRSNSRFSFDASSVRSGDSREDDLVSNSSFASSSANQSGSFSMGRRNNNPAASLLTRTKLDHIRPPTVQTRQVHDLTDMVTVNKAIREGAMIVLSFSTDIGLAQWIQTIRNRKATVEAIVKTIDNPQLLASWQRKSIIEGATPPEEGFRSLSGSPTHIADERKRADGMDVLGVNSKVPSAPSTPRSFPASPPSMSREASFLATKSVHTLSRSSSPTPSGSQSLGGSSNFGYDLGSGKANKRDAYKSPILQKGIGGLVSNASISFL